MAPGRRFAANVIWRFAVPVLLAGIIALSAQPAAPVQSEITSDRNVLDATTGEVLLTGNVRLQDDNVLLTADEARWNHNTAVATAVGNVVLTRGDTRLLADRVVYHRATGTFTADGVRFGSYPYFVEGFSAEGSRNEITITRAKLSYGEPGPWQPTVIADKVIIAPGKRVRTGKAAGGIGHVQPLPFPRFEQDIGQPFPMTVSLTGGFRSSLGVFADAALHVPISPAVRLGVDVGLFTNRGVMAGPSGRYQKRDAPEQLRGYLRSGFINDHGDKKTDILGRPVPEERAFAEWQHQQTLAPNLTLHAQLNWWKDSEVLRDFRPRAFFPVQEPDTFVETVYAGPNFFLSAFARFQPNRFHRVQQRLPEVRFDLLPMALANGFYQRLEASVAVLREDETLTTRATRTQPLLSARGGQIVLLPGGEISRSTLEFEPPIYTTRSGERIAPRFFGLKSQTTRVDAYYGLERPIAPTEWLAFTPLAGARLTSYSRTRDTAIFNSGPARHPVTIVGGTYTRLLGEVGADVAVRTSGVFDYKNPRWKIDGLRHLLTPRLGYRYIPRGDKGRDRILPIDQEVFSTYLPPLGLGAQRNLDDLHATNTLRLALDNILQTRDATLGTRDLLVVNVANDFRFRRRPGERSVSETHVELAAMPAPWLQFDLYGSAAPRNLSVRELNSGITLRDGDVWALRFGNNYLRRDIQDFSIDGRIRLNERYEARTKLHYDARRQRFNEQSYGIAQNLGNTWLVTYTVSLYSGRRRESGFGFRIDVDAVRF